MMIARIEDLDNAEKLSINKFSVYEIRDWLLEIV